MSSPTKTSPLRIAPIATDDYNLIGALDTPHGQLIEDLTKIGQTFALYFSFPKYGSVAFSKKKAGDGARDSWNNCVLDYDRDEREPSELWIRITKEKNLPKEGEQIEVQISLFGTCFSFFEKVISSSEFSEEEFIIVIQPPTTILSIQQRSLPRLKLTKQNISDIGPVYWKSRSGLEKIQVVPNEIGVNSIMISEPSATLANDGLILIAGLEIPVRLLRNSDQGTAFGFQFESPTNYGEYFEFYREKAYPNLRPRDSFSDDAAGKLFEKTEYLGKFTTVDDRSRYLADLAETRDKIKSGRHSTIVEYFAVDEKEEPIGCSSLALAFRTTSEDIWAFHQLCATTSPELLLHSGELYKWRAEYLAGFPGPLSVTGWFDGRSRWLDRLYVKFTKQATIRASLNAIALIEKKFTFSSPTDSTSIQSNSYSIGTVKRWTTSTEKIFSGAQPELLNASRGLDKIVVLDSSVSWNDICSHSAELAKNVSRNEIQLRVSLPTEWAHFANIGEHSRIDSVSRMFLFSKDDLVPFMNAVEHSIAITRRKYNVA